MQHFKFYNKEDALYFTRMRRFETKLGEQVQVIDNSSSFAESIKQSLAKYVLLGVPEDIGVKANYGIGGADTVWISFLQSFLNIQSNDFLDGKEILLLGHFDFGDVPYLIDNTAN